MVEDTEYDENYIETHFGTSVARLVYGVTKLKKINELSNSLRPVAENKDEVRAESLRKMFLAMAEDIRVLIKLADRLHNMRTLSAKEDHKRRRIARDAGYLCPACQSAWHLGNQIRIRRPCFAWSQPPIKSWQSLCCKDNPNTKSRLR